MDILGDDALATSRSTALGALAPLQLQRCLKLPMG